MNTNLHYRHEARKIAMSFLYQQETKNRTTDEGWQLFISSFGHAEQRVNDYAQLLGRGYLNFASEIDGLIVSSLRQWSLDRIANIDRAILRVALFELLHQNDMPVAIVIDEAIELAKEFGTSDSAQFVNGLLDRVHQERLTGK